MKATELTIGFLIGLGYVAPAAAQDPLLEYAAQGWRAPIEYTVAPYVAIVGAPIRTQQQSIGMHLIWPADRNTTLAARYEIRWADSRVQDCGTIDLVQRLVGTDTASLALTGGWARWGHRNYTSVGGRAAWPFIAPEQGGSIALQAWIDVRYAVGSTREIVQFDGTSWITFMIVAVVPGQIRRTRR